MGKLLDWDNLPPNGTKVKFIGYNERGIIHTHWGFIEGDVYEIKDHELGTGDRGVESPSGDVARINFGFIFEIIDQPFTKSDLKDGMRVEHQNGEIGYVCGDEILFPRDGVCTRITRHIEGLLNKRLVSSYAIIRVTDRDGTVLFEREPEKVKLELEVTPEQAEAIRKQLGQ